MKLIGISVAAVFLTIILLSLFQVSAGMSVFATGNCAHYTDTSTLCPFATLGQLDQWKTTFLTTVVSAWSVLVLLVLVTIFLPVSFPRLSYGQMWYQVLLHYDHRLRLAYYANLHAIVSYMVRAWQKFFADGILKPKTF